MVILVIECVKNILLNISFISLFDACFTSSLIINFFFRGIWSSNY